jgi:hypothetical protein
MGLLLLTVNITWVLTTIQIAAGTPFRNKITGYLTPPKLAYTPFCYCQLKLRKELKYSTSTPVQSLSFA